MKAVLREAGVPCAASAAVSSAAEAREFAAAVGFPMIIKPRAAASAAGTYRANSGPELDHVLHKVDLSHFRRDSSAACP
jgi:biotin carboxylase